MNLVTVIPPPGPEGEPTRAIGTKFVLADGSEILGVTRVVLTAEVGKDLWRAQIECFVRASDMPNVLAQIEVNAFPEPSEQEP